MGSSIIKPILTDFAPPLAPGGYRLKRKAWFLTLCTLLQNFIERPVGDVIDSPMMGQLNCHLF